ncbi:MAG: TolC family protein [Ignavibacteria bacterium]|nr:TolC family protein [Ignavibacteria bacterium]MCU7504575.1 TolC family protein [Ignavibacteria bacterium]MCU7516587.1 TolC family protein [Ignavibacteria bacterium]
MKKTVNISRVLALLLMVFTFMPPVAWAQSVDSLVNEAIKNNPRLKSFEAKTRSAEFRAESFNSAQAPTLGIQFSEIPFGKYNIVNDALSNEVSLSQMFMLGGKISAMTESERKNAVVQGDNYKVYKVNLIGQVKMAYYGLWMNERKIEVQKRNIDLYNNLINYLTTNYSVNRASQADILTLKGEIASSQTQLVTLQREFESGTYKLNQLLGRDLSSGDIKIAKEIPNDTLALTQAELEDMLANLNPSLKQMSNMVEMNKAMITANQKDRIPDLMLQAMVMRQPQGMILTSKTDLSMLSMGMEEPKTEYMYSLMASITLPFAPWSKGKFQAREEELYAGIKGIEYEKSDMQRDMTAQLKASVTKYKTAEDLLKLYSGNVIPLYEQAAQAQLTAYQSNQTSVATIIDTYRMLLMQQMNYYMAQADLQMSLAEIEMMVGGPVK